MCPQLLQKLHIKVLKEYIKNLKSILPCSDQQLLMEYSLMQCCRFSGFCGLPAKNFGFCAFHSIFFLLNGPLLSKLGVHDKGFLGWSWNSDSIFKNDLKIAGFGMTCWNMHLLGVYEGKIRIFIRNYIGACEFISPFLALHSFWKKFASRFFGRMHFSGNFAVSHWQHCWCLSWITRDCIS